MTRDAIIDRLLKSGFYEATKGLKEKDGLASVGYRHPSLQGRGSVYVATDYLSATGVYKRLGDYVPTGKQDHQGYPYWQGEALREVLGQVERLFA